MTTMRLLEERGTLDWEYDAEADVLYLSLGEPRPGVGMDIGDGLVIRYDEGAGEVALAKTQSRSPSPTLKKKWL